MSRNLIFGLLAIASVGLTSIPAQAWGHHLHGHIVRYAPGGVYVAISSGALIFVPFGSQFFLGGALITIGGPGAYPVGEVIDASYGPGNTYLGYSGGSYYSPTYRTQHPQWNRGNGGQASNRGARSAGNNRTAGSGGHVAQAGTTRSQPAHAQASRPQASARPAVAPRSSARPAAARPAAGGGHAEEGGHERK